MLFGQIYGYGDLPSPKRTLKEGLARNTKKTHRTNAFLLNVVRANVFFSLCLRVSKFESCWVYQTASCFRETRSAWSLGKLAAALHKALTIKALQLESRYLPSSPHLEMISQSILTAVCSIVFIMPPTCPFPTGCYNVRLLHLLHIRWLPPCHCSGHRINCRSHVSSHRCGLRSFIPYI